jgi:hypothetical protein
VTDGDDAEQGGQEDDQPVCECGGPEAPPDGVTVGAGVDPLPPGLVYQFGPEDGEGECQAELQPGEEPRIDQRRIGGHDAVVDGARTPESEDGTAGGKEEEREDE